MTPPFRCLLSTAILFGLSSVLFGQFRGGSDWSNNGGDAQRSSWVRADAKITPASLAAPGLQLVWKLKLDNEAHPSNTLSTPVLLDRYIGYRGFRTYAFIGGSGENVFAMDSDLGRVEWQKQFPVNGARGTGNCAGGMTAGLVRPVSSSFPSSVNAGRYGGMGGRGRAAQSGVGEPYEGAVTLAQMAATRPAIPGAAIAPPLSANRLATPPIVTPARPTTPAGGLSPRATLLFALSSDGSFHSLYVSNGDEPEAPIKFLPPNANVSDLAVVDGSAYATTVNHCGGVPDGVWALDLTTKAMTQWQGAPTGGEPAFAPADRLYVTSQTKLLALDKKTLAASDSYDAGQPFSTAPLVFEYKDKTMIAAASKDGVLHLVDSASPSKAAAKSTAGDSDPYALASWQTVAGTRRVLVTTAKSITAWKVVDQNGGLTLQQDWTVHDVPAPAAPLIINGVLFALERGDGHHNPVLYAFDAANGKKLWSSGNVVGSFVPPAGGLAAGGSTIYFGTRDGTFWAFGFPIEH